MKVLEKISHELKLQLDVQNLYFGEISDEVYYEGLSGFLEGEYFNIYLKKYRDLSPVIEIAHTTDNPKKIVEMIQSIDNNVQIIYSVKEVTYKQIVIN